MTRPPDLVGPAGPVTPRVGVRRIPRFARPVRWVHRSSGLLMAVCLFTAATLYEPTLAVLVGHRYLVEQVHVWCGLALPVPLLLGMLSADVRADVSRLSRFVPGDGRWLRSRTRRTDGLRVGKFNAGQKLNASLSLAAVGVLLGTGALMYWTGLARLTWRTGATFVHDWTAIALGLLILGHMSHALRDPVALRGMKKGDVSLRWARRQHPAWADEIAGPADPADDD